jgi:hypothetical protein
MRSKALIGNKKETQMNQTQKNLLRLARGLASCVLALLPALVAAGQVTTTTVQGTVYLANGLPGAGNLHITWPSFTTASNQAVAAGSLDVAIGADGFVTVNLAPNLGATPAGLYYTAVYDMSDGSTNTEYWVVPAAAQASIGAVRSQVLPAAQAVQAVSKAYVDQAIAQLEGSLLTASGGTLSGPLYLCCDPTQPLEAADKHYVDTTFNMEVPITGGTMTGPLQVPAVNGVESPLAGTSQTTLQAAMNAAGTTGALEIPPTYAGTDAFTNPNGLYVLDLRPHGAEPHARTVKEFGAVCDGVTDDTNALQAALNYADAHNVAITLPQGTCKTQTLNWHGESIAGEGKQVSALLGFPGQDVLASQPDAMNLLSYTRLHDFTIYVDQSQDVSCSAAEGRAAAGSCVVSRLLESNSIFSPGGNGLTGTVGTGAAYAIGNCAIAMPAATGLGGNGLRVAEIENIEIATTGADPLAQYPGAHSTHTCGLYLAQWPQWSDFRNIDIRGLNTAIAIPALPVTPPAGLTADSNRWQNITLQASHAFVAEVGSNNVLDNVLAQAGNSAATAEPPTGLILNLPASAQSWTVRDALVAPAWNVVQPKLTVAAAGGAVTSVTVGPEDGLGFDPYGATIPVVFSGACTAQANAGVNSDGSIGTVAVTYGGVGCSATTTASLNVASTWDTAAPVNLIAGQSMSFFGGNLLNGNGGYTVWNATASQSYGEQVGGGGGRLPSGSGTYPALVMNGKLGSVYAVDQFPGADFGAKLEACLTSLSATNGGTCDARNFTGTQAMGSNLTISTGNATALLPCATISTASQIVVAAGTRNVSLRGCALRGGTAANGAIGGTDLAYTGAAAALQVGDPTYAADTQGFHLDNVVLNTTGSTSATAQGFVAYRTQELDLESLYFLGNSNQTGMTLDGTGNYTGGTFLDNELDGFATAVNAIGHQVSNPATTDWMNASSFVRLHIDCPTSGGNPIAGTYGINLQQGDGNTFTGGDVEGCATALHLGANAQNNTIVGLRNENSTSQVVADSGSSYNSWITGGTMFTGKLTDNGTRNSFLDTFHRSFNGLNGDWYGSQQDATITNHWRLGIGTGNERGLLNRYQTDYGYRWTIGLSDATAGEQFYQLLDELNSVYRISIGQYNNGASSTNNQTVINAAGTGGIILNGSNNSGTGGVVFGSGGPSETTVALVDNLGDATFDGNLTVDGTSTFAGSPTVRNGADAEIDYFLWAGATTSQKESLIYKDWNGASQWYLVKDASNNWALNSATGGLDSFKAYQSTNSGDTYVDASNSSGVVRVNYETGSGAAFKVYGGNSSTLYASFTGTNAIQFPGLAASSGHFCLQVDNSGFITNTGTACGTGGGGSGTISSGTNGQIAYYSGTGTSLAGETTVAVANGGTGASTASAGLANLNGISSTQTTAQSISGPITIPVVNNLTNFAGLSGSSVSAQFNNWISNTGTSGTRSVLWVDPQIGAGSPTSALGSLERIFDARGTNCMDSVGGFSYADNSICIEAADDSADSTTTVTNKADLHLSYNSIAGGVYNFTGSSGTKSNRSVLALNGEYSTVAQKWGVNSAFSSYAGGETIPFSANLTEYGGYVSSGQEPSEGVRIQQQQGALSDSQSGVWSATASSVNSTTGVVAFSSPTNSATLGESRFIRDLGTKYSTGTYSAVSCSGSNPTTCTIAGSGTSWTSIPGFVGTHTTFNGVALGGNILTNNLVFCAAPGADGGFDACVPITSGVSATSLTVNLYGVGTQANTPWPWATSGSYAIYASAYPTAVNVASSTFTAGDVSGLNAGDTLDQVLAYNGDFYGLQLVQSRTIGRTYGGGINIANIGSSTSPAFAAGAAVSGNYACAFCVQTSNESSGAPQIDVEFFARPASGEASIVDASPASTSSYNFYQTRMSDNSTGNVLAVNPNMGSSSVGLDIFGTALTVGANSNGVAVNGNPNSSAQFAVNVASAATYGILDAEATGPLCNGCSVIDIDGMPSGGQTNYKRFADNGFGVLSEQNNNGMVTTWYSNAGATQTAQVNGATGAAGFASITDTGLAGATVVGTSSAGLLQSTPTSGSGAVALVSGPTFTGNATTFANNAASEDDVVIQPGSTADQVGAVQFNNYSGAAQWKLRKDSSNTMRVTDAANSLDRAVYFQNGQTTVNSGSGVNAVAINNTSGSGTGGFIVYEGGTSYNTAAFTVTSSGNTTATGFLSGKFLIGTGTMTLTAGSAAGTSPTIACASSHVCDGVSGTVNLTTGTGPATGTLATLGFPNTHTNQANCVVAPTLSGTGLVTSITWSESTTALTLTANTALAASTAYQIRYWCGGN